MDNISDKRVREKVFKKYNGCCAYCGVLLKDRFTIDHLIPKRRYNTNKEHGKDEISNYMPCCHSCNSLKCNLELEEFRGMIERKQTVLKRDSASYRALLRFNMIEEKHSPLVFFFEGGLK